MNAIHPAEKIRAAYNRAIRSLEDARHHALICGALLLEQRAAVGHGSWQEWLQQHVPEIEIRTAQRWMRLAERALEKNEAPLRKLGWSPATRTIDVASEKIPISDVLEGNRKLPAPAAEARQLLLEFVADQTISEAVNGVLLHHQDPVAAERAANGRTKGGYCGEDRRDWPRYIERNLRLIGGLLGAHAKDPEARWARMSAAQREAIRDAFSRAIKRWPVALVEHIARAATAQIKGR